MVFVCSPDRVAEVEAVTRKELRRHVRQGRTQVWRGGIAPDGIEELVRVAQVGETRRRGVEGRFVFAQRMPRNPSSAGAPTGTSKHVADHLAHKSREQETLFMRIPTVQDTQACWLLLLMCASTRANVWLRMIRPDLTLQCAERHDAAVWHCLCAILGSPGAPVDAQVTASFPLSMGGFGLTSAVRSRVAAHWSSWADCIKMVRDRHPIVADVIMRGIDDHPALCFDALRTCEHAPGFFERGRSPRQLARHPKPNGPKFGWQHRANLSLEEQRFASHWAELSQPVKALWRSQRGLLASAALTIPRLVVSTPSPAPPSHLPQLPMWPPT